MAPMFRISFRILRYPLFWRRSVCRPPSPAREFSQSSSLIDSTDDLEEETLPWYTPDGFYPVKKKRGIQIEIPGHWKTRLWWIFHRLALQGPTVSSPDLDTGYYKD